ncbi:MAG: hypothetical protein QOH76_2113 [Thermoleophilaceae bacterium]|nr:hypothetical protein [Thermoleophilaceae bacterium]
MRTELGIAGVTALLVIAGQGILLGIGLTRVALRSLLASAGLAYLVGAAATMLIGVVLITLGGEVTLPVFVAIALLLGATGAGLAYRRAATPPATEAEVEAEPSGASRGQKLIVGAALALVAALLVLGMLHAGVRPLAEWDSWSIWTRKAVVLTSGGLDARIFDGMPYGFAHLEYPVLLPLFEAVHFRAMGGVDGQAIHAALWILYVACLGSIAYLGSRFARIWVWLPAVLALAFGSQFYGQLLTAYADVPMALFAAPGVLCIGLWLRRLDWRYLLVGSLLLAAAANVKNEGTLLAVATFAAAAVVLAAGRSWRSLLTLGAGFAGVLVALAPWRLWVHGHGIKGSFPLSETFDLGKLPDRLDRIGPSLKTLYPQFESGALSFIVPFALVLVLVALTTRGLRGIAAFYLVAGLLTFSTVTWALVVTPPGVAYQATTYTRVIMGTTSIALAALLHLGALLDRWRPEATPQSP